MKFERTTLVGGSINSLRLPETAKDVQGSIAVVQGSISRHDQDVGLIRTPVRPTKIYDFIGTVFTHAGSTGRTGPTLAQCLSAYSESSWASDRELFDVQDGIQIWTVPDNGVYQISAYGAEGGGPTANNNQDYGGDGAKVQGDFYLKSGTKLKILVGQIGRGGSYSNTGGGGGSFVFLNEGRELSDLLLAAGGGGGSGNSSNAHGADATIDTDGTSGIGAVNAAGGVDGHGGESVTNAGGGAGFFSNGAHAHNSDDSTSARCPAEGGFGGSGRVDGGFGGGGAFSSGGDGAGGGGGFSGGGASERARSSGRARGGGGGSFNAGENQQNESGANAGPGYVKITWLGE